MPKKVNQVAIVVKDLDKAVKFYQDVIGIGPFQIMDRPVEECELYGSKTQFQIKTALCMNEGMQLEIIQVMQGCNAHSEFLQEKGEGIHHFGFYVDDLEAEIKKYADHGIKVLSQGGYMGVKWAYMDTAPQCGSVQEFIELPKPKPNRKKLEETTAVK